MKLLYDYFIALSSQIKFTVAVDTVLNVSKDTSLASLPKLFISAMCSQLRKMASVITQFSKVRFSQTFYLFYLFYIFLSLAKETW